MKACTSKNLRNLKLGNLPWTISKGVFEDSTCVGSLLIMNTTVTKAFHQKQKGILAWAKRVRPSSTMCLCFLSTLPFWWWAWGQECLNWMPSWCRKGVRHLYSPPQSLCKQISFLLNIRSAIEWKWTKAALTSDFPFKG